MYNETIPQKTQITLARHYGAASAKVLELCKEAQLPDEIAKAILQDLDDILQDRYSGLHLNAEGRELLAEKTTLQQWKNLHSPALTELWDEYNDVQQAFVTNTQEELQNIFCDAEKLRALFDKDSGYTAISIYEAARALGADNAELFNYAVILRHIHFILLCFVALEVSLNELRDVVPVNIATPLTETRQEWIERHIKINYVALYNLAEAMKKEAEKAKAKANPIAGIKDDEGKPIPSSLNAPEAVAETYAGKKEKTTAIPQNIAAMLGATLLVNDKEKSETAPLQPLRQALEQMQANADALKAQVEKMQSDSNTTAEALNAALQLKAEADSLTASQTYVMQVFTGLQHIAGRTPKAVTTNYYDFGDMDANDFLRECVGCKTDEKGNLQSIGGKQRVGIFCAANIVSRIRTQATEDALIPYKVKDEEGKYRTEYGKQTIKYTFNPAIITFKSITGDLVKPAEAEKVGLQIFRPMIEGRKEDFVMLTDEATGKRVKRKVKLPMKHVVTDAQLYAFTTDEEKRIFHILLSNPEHKKESELLAEAFDYVGRREIAKDTYKKAEADLDAISRELELHNLTRAEIEQHAEYLAKRAAVESAEQNIKNVEHLITKNKARDREKLRSILLKAAQVGIIETYWREPPEGGCGVWNWRKPSTGEEKKKRKKAGR